MSERLSRGLVRLLIRLYPEPVRAEYGEEIEATCRRRRRALGQIGSATAIFFWVRELLGLIQGMWAARREQPRHSGGPSIRAEPARCVDDLRLGARQLGRRPGVVVVSVVTLGLGIGANGAMSGLGWAVLKGPLPFPDSERLVRIFHSHDLSFGVSLNELLEYRRSARTLVDIAGWHVRAATHQRADGSRRIVAATVTPNFFEALGRRPAIGGAFEPGGNRRQIVFSHRYWAQSFGKDRGAIGRQVEVDEKFFEVAGILPEDFVFPDPAIDVLIPIDVSAGSGGRRGNVFLNVVARLAEGVDLEAASAEASYLAQRMREASPADYQAEPEFGAHLVYLREALSDSQKPLLTAMMVGAGLVLLVTFLNVATLLLAYIESRASDIAIRRSLGATALDIARGFAAQGLLIAAAGGLAGGLVAFWTAGILGRLMPVSVFGSHIPIGVLAAVVAGAGVAGFFFSVLPLPFVIRSLRMASTRAARLVSGGTVIRLLQTAAAVILVVAATLLLATVRNLTAADLGYRTVDILSARITLPAGRYTSHEAALEFWTTLMNRLTHNPQIRSAGVVNALPLGGPGGSGDVFVEKPGPEVAVDVISQRLASPGYFQTLGIPLLAGRLPADTDQVFTPRVAVVDEDFATNFFGRPRDAVGRRVRAFLGGSGWNDIVGVVGSVRHSGPRAEASPVVYFPVSQRSARGLHLVLRLEADAGQPARIVRQTTASIDPQLAVYDIAMMEDRLNASISRNQLLSVLFGGFAALAVGLSGLGLYSSVSLAQQRRAREMGIRRALGARPAHVLWVMARPAMGTVVVGIVSGLAVSWQLVTLLDSLLFQVSPRDPVVLAAAALLILAAGSASSVVPAFKCLRPRLARVLNAEDRAGVSNRG